MSLHYSYNVAFAFPQSRIPRAEQPVIKEVDHVYASSQ